MSDTDHERETGALAHFIHDFVDRSPSIEHYVLVTFTKAGHPSVATNTDPRKVHELFLQLSHGRAFVREIEEHKIEDGKSN